MPPRPRKPVAYKDSDSEGTDAASPPPPKRPGKGKRKVSAVFDPDASFASNNSGANASSSRVPFKPVALNDDAAEKRKRRQSTKLSLSLNGESGPGTPSKEKQSALARANQLHSVAPPTPPPVVPIEIMSSNFEEWMKMATDNKINATNSWNFALIDYFHDMSLLRNELDNSINFQKASCTLDGCVKIWTSRVDSVGTETGKLLSNLASEGRGGNAEDAEAEDGEDGESGQQKKKRAHRAEATLAKNAAQLRTKKLDLEFTVDPLFKKTCADFDEGGAQGLLMNHLAVDGNCRVVFDAGDSKGVGEDEDEEEEGPGDLIPLEELRGKFAFTDVANKTITATLANFHFSSDPKDFDISALNASIDISHHEDFDSGDEADFGHHETTDVPMPDADAPVQDFFSGDQAVDDFTGANDFGGGDYTQEGGEGQTEEGSRAPFVPFDPRRVPNERDLVMAMTEGDGDGMMDYFDSGFLKNWAGPEHWKLRKAVRRPDATADPAKPKAKREKQTFQIDFMTPMEVSLKELFAPSTRGGLTLPGTALGKKKGKKGTADVKRDDKTLPDDMHFSSRQLLTLFLKPKFVLKMRGHRPKIDANGDGEVDEHFWAQAAADQARRGAEDEMDETHGGGAIPFNTQFFHDDYDDGPGFDDVYDGDGAPLPPVEDEDLLAATQGQVKRARPEFVQYAKKAKRVDVRKLKDNIWKGLDIVVPPVEGAEPDTTTEDKPPTDPTEAREFTSVIQGLRQQYPKEKMEEISTSFCFICLLHLANERGLKIAAGEGEQKEDAPDADDARKVGDIWGLKIYRDPNAIPSA